MLDPDGGQRSREEDERTAPAAANQSHNHRLLAATCDDVKLVPFFFPKNVLYLFMIYI